MRFEPRVHTLFLTPFYSPTNTITMNKICRTSVTVTIFSLLLIALGCSSDKKSKVTGSVTYKNAPVPGGNLTFSSDSGGSYSSPIQQDGTYLITDIPAGTYTVTIETETVNPDRAAPAYGTGKEKAAPSGAKQLAGKMEKASNEYAEKMGKGGGGGDDSFGPAPREELLKRYTKIPIKYADKRISGLTAEVGTGSAKIDFPLSD